MSIEREKFDGFDELELFCDDCGEGHGVTFMADAFKRMLEQARDDGWQIKPDASKESGWRHVCGLCADGDWRPVVGYEGAYEVSDRGEVRSVNRVVRVVDGTREYFRKDRAREMSVRPDSEGYSAVTLTKSGTSIKFRVHVLVLEAFVGPRGSGEQACHGNGNRADPRLANLRYDTVAGNARDREAHGTHAIGEANPGAKLTREQVREIIRRRNAGELLRSIGEDFGIDPSTVCRISRGRAWSKDCVGIKVEAPSADSLGHVYDDDIEELL